MRLRLAYAIVYGGLTALGAALLARPAGLWLRGLGLFAPTLPWDVPAGSAAAGLLFALAAGAARLGAALALRHSLSAAAHAALLAGIAAAAVVRSFGEPAPPRSPDQALFAALRASAEALDVAYASELRYDPGAVQRAVESLPSAGFVFRGRSLHFVVRVARAAIGPERAPAPSDGPGTIVVAISPNAQRAWLSATTMRGGAVAMLGAIVEADAGSHSALGGDAAFPVYPRTLGVTP